MKITRETLQDGSLRAYRERFARDNPDITWRSDAEMERLLEETLSAHNPADDLWVFGYGSLIWNPAIDHTECRRATLHGWHRRFCLKMYMARGTPEHPGLMLALDSGGACQGVAYRIEAVKARGELELLWQREMFGGAYNAHWVRLEAEGEHFPALTFVINRANPRYVPHLSVEETAAIIATARGDTGTAREYFENTVTHLRELDMQDAGLERIARALPTA